jgi:hypothetical protein
MNKGTVVPRVDEIVRRREDKGWSQEKLASESARFKEGKDETDMRRSVQRAEVGNPIRLSTLGCIARALGCEPKELISTREQAESALDRSPVEGRNETWNGAHRPRAVVIPEPFSYLEKRKELACPRPESQGIGPPLDRFEKAEATRHKRRATAPRLRTALGLTGAMVAAFLSGYYFASAGSGSTASQIKIQLPGRYIETNTTTVFGTCTAWIDKDIKLIVRPLDDRDVYYVNKPERPAVIQDGAWSLECRFGDEYATSMIQPLPLDFAVYALLIDRGTTLPFDPDPGSISKPTEREFVEEMKKYGTLSDRVVITRRPPSKPPYFARIEHRGRAVIDRCHQPADELIVRSIPPYAATGSPIKLIWEGGGRLLVRVYHDAQELTEHSGERDSGVELDLEVRTRPYEIKLSRDARSPSSSVWLEIVKHQSS